MRQQTPGTASPQQVADCIHDFKSVVLSRSATSFGLRDVWPNILTFVGAEIAAINPSCFGFGHGLLLVVGFTHAYLPYV